MSEQQNQAANTTDQTKQATMETGAMTLSQRKKLAQGVQQQSANKLTPKAETEATPGEIEAANTGPAKYSDEWIKLQIRKQLGYDNVDLYIDAEDKARIEKMTEIDKEMVINDRREKARDNKYKLEQQRTMHLQLQKQMQQNKQIGKRSKPKHGGDYGSSYDSEESGQASSDKSSSSSDEEGSDYGETEAQKRKRQIKQQQKRKEKNNKLRNKGDMVEMVRFSSSGSEDSANMSGHDSDSYDRHRRSRHRSGRDLRDKHHHLEDKEHDLRSIELKDFKRIVIKRQDFANLIEHEKFREKLKQAFVRVLNNKRYVLAQISDFKQGVETYKVEQTETKYQLMLKYAGKVKQFKLNLVSNQDCEEKEFQAMKRDNPNTIYISEPIFSYTVDWPFLIQKCRDIKEAQMIQHDAEEVSKLLYQQMQEKLRQGKIDGLNLSELKIQLFGEVHLIQWSLTQDDLDPDERDNLIKKQVQVKEYIKQVEQAVIKKQKLASNNLVDKKEAELQEWLYIQNRIKEKPVAPGSNVFTFKQRFFEGEEDATGGKVDVKDDELNQELQLIKLRSQKSMSGLPTMNDADKQKDVQKIQQWSYFEKVERLKKKIIQTHQKIELNHLDAHFKRLIDDNIKVIPYQNMQIDCHQPAHEDWKQEQLRQQRAKLENSTNVQVISIEDYFNM